MIRDFELLLKIGDGNQLTIDTIGVWADLRQAIRKLGGSVWDVAALPPYARWSFSCYPPFDYTKASVDRAVNNRIPWILSCENRVEYWGIGYREQDALRHAFEARGVG